MGTRIKLDWLPLLDGHCRRRKFWGWEGGGSGGGGGGVVGVGDDRGMSCRPLAV